MTDQSEVPVSAMGSSELLLGLKTTEAVLNLACSLVKDLDINLILGIYTFLDRLRTYQSEGSASSLGHRNDILYARKTMLIEWSYVIQTCAFQCSYHDLDTHHLLLLSD